MSFLCTDNYFSVYRLLLSMISRNSLIMILFSRCIDNYYHTIIYKVLRARYARIYKVYNL